jgi:DNA-binding SARP family transcriptional activator/tetratricopeptide (TPR) repeat protein
VPNAAALRVALLGPVRAWLADEEVALGPARQRTVFAVLAAHPGRRVSRADLIRALWGPAPPATAAGSVYTYVSGLRRGLAPARSGRLLASGPSGYALLVDEDAVDAHRFARLCAEAGAELDRGGPERVLAALDAALALWRGEAYAGLSGDFVAADRRRLADLRLAAIERRARVLLATGGDDGLVAELTALAGEHPLRESLHELLMLALHRSGRESEALDAFRAARRTLVAELGVEPGPALQDLHRQVLAASADAPAAAPPGPAPAPIVPTQVARALQEGLHSRPYVGRSAEVALLRGLVRDVAAGRGRAVWIDGEPGMGKTELLTVALADATALGCGLAWAVADELGRRVPLQVVTKALGLETSSADPRAAALTAQLHGDSHPGDPQGSVAVSRVLSYVRNGPCADAPLVLVIDDMQWADEASLLVWERLAALTRRLPLLLVAASRPEPYGRDLARLRRSVEVRQGHVLTLTPLPPADVEELIGAVVGAEPGGSLRALAPVAAGNPLYAREMAAGLVRRQEVRVVGGHAEVDAAAAAEVPQSLLAAVRGTVDFLTPETTEVLRLAALLGTQFAVGDVAAVSGQAPFDLMRHLDEAVAGHVVVAAGTDLAFRHPFLRQALYEGIPAAARAVRHRYAAEALARGGGSVVRVAEQLAADETVVDGWVLEWLVGARAELTRVAPAIAGQLFRAALNAGATTAKQRELLLIALVRLDFRYDRFPVAEARQAIGVATDPADLAEMRQLLAAMRHRRGDTRGAIALLRGAVDDPAVPPIWQTRHRVLLANFRRGSLDDLDAAERNAGAIIAEAQAAGQPYEEAFALQTLWLVNSIRRDHGTALGNLDRAMDLVRERPELAGVYFDLLDNRMFSLQNLDRLGDAQRTLREAAQFAAAHGLPASLQVATAVQCYWLGRWDEALAEVSAVTEDAPGITFYGMREPGAVMILLRGVAALIAGHRDLLEVALSHLDAVEALPATAAERESFDFLLVAQSLVAEHEGRHAEALDALEPLLRRAYAPMMLRHQWLPDAARLALEIGRGEVAERAAEICAEQAARETVPARAWAAAARCRSLLTGDAGPVLAAAAHYRAVGRVPELAAALEDAAVLLARAGRAAEAAGPARESTDLFATLGATWDLGRAARRLAAAGLDLPGDPVTPAPQPLGTRP